MASKLSARQASSIVKIQTAFRNVLSSSAREDQEMSLPSLQIESAEHQAEDMREPPIRISSDGIISSSLPECFPYNEIHDKDRACIIAEGEQVSPLIP